MINAFFAAGSGHVYQSTGTDVLTNFACPVNQGELLWAYVACGFLGMLIGSWISR